MTMHRVLVIVPFPMSAENLEKRRAQLRAVRLVEGVSFEFRPVAFAPSGYVSQHDSVLADLGILAAGVNAQAEGFDAVCIDTMSDSGMTPLRAALDIPVIGPGRHAMLSALMLGERFSILAMWDKWRHLYAKTLADLGLGDKCASVRAAGLRPDNQSLLGGKEDETFPALHRAALQCVEEDGADVIVLGSTTMHEAHGYLAERLPVPVINPGPLTYRMAIAALGLGHRHSRRAYPAAATSETAHLRALAEAGAVLTERG